MVGVPFSCGKEALGRMCPSLPVVDEMGMCVVLD